MLKRLELVGFKSFADKTSFEFGPGITAIVGPNGSGKSNVVDAVRWILGEQSAKSLRGGEMADVIFNGSSSRRGLGMADVSLVLDNSRRLLAVDSDEIHVTRRVYRDGEGEYLINKQPARLRDIKELFLGSGAGADAYCIIEQGRVDVLLQASTRERRTIFEEAAGISRFKVKKLETVRKLERVEQNLQRLRDIIDEVERQLQSVKLQAAKAQRYQEYSARLKELRVAVALTEYRHFSVKLNEVAGALDGARSRLQERLLLAGETEAALERLERVLLEQGEVAQKAGGRLGEARQLMASEEVTLHHEQQRSANLEQDLAQVRSQLHGVGRELAAMTGALDTACREREEAEAECSRRREAAQQAENDLSRTISRVHAWRDQVEADKVDLMEQLRQSARMHNEVVGLKAQADSLAHHRGRLERKTSQTRDDLAHTDNEVRGLQQGEEALQSRLDAARHELSKLRERRDELRAEIGGAGQQLAAVREQRSGLTSRIQVLERLEQSREGLGTGVREVLDLLTEADPGPWGTIVGLVADLLTVPSEHAALIDLALGARSQCFVVRDAAQLAEALATRSQPFAARVGFIPLMRGPIPGHADGLPDHPGVRGSAASLVRCSVPDCSALPQQLLGDTLIVSDLTTARELAALTNAFRYLTLAGELLEPDGTLTIGAHHAETGIVSRKSELRELRDQVIGLDQAIAAGETQLDVLRSALEQLDSQETTAQRDVEVLAEQAADFRSRLTQQRQRHEGLAQELHLSRAELQQTDEELGALQAAEREADAAARTADDRVQQLQARLGSAETEIRQLEQQRYREQQASTAAKVALATADERRHALVARHQRAAHDLQQRTSDQHRLQEQLAILEDRLAASAQAMLCASAVLARAYHDKELAETEVRAAQERVEQIRCERQRHAEEAQLARQQCQHLQAEVHAKELEASDLQHRRFGLCDRLREEHDLDLEALSQSDAALGQPLDGPGTEEEMAELRRKIARLGSVSLDALQELQDLAGRAKSLHDQHADLTAAKSALDEIITKINHDSRKHFLETFAAVRDHFQELFRKLFGGGMADIILENEDDVLESGVEIIARPPGKELRSISLMSGGEKTLTAVALLLAIFRSKPSPFCILDEVDAALDEANVGRYMAVLREFLDRSQFIIVTHSKKTMAETDVLYGVTMQESGVSKRVAVRFEDWPEEDVASSAETPPPPSDPSRIAA